MIFAKAQGAKKYDVYVQKKRYQSRMTVMTGKLRKKGICQRLAEAIATDLSRYIYL